MNTPRQRPLSLDGLRAFEAVARRLSFSAAADELHLTQPAVSRQIKSLETEIGVGLFNRGTRKVELTSAGLLLQQAVVPALERVDRSVRQLRVVNGRKCVNLSTFASFATLWLMPRLAGFERNHPGIDIRISATDVRVDTDDTDVDLVLRYDYPAQVPRQAQRLFGETLSPIVSPWLKPLPRRPSDLTTHSLLEQDDHRPSAASLSWRRWLNLHGVASLEPKRWVYLNYTHQHVQGALTGQGIALARLALVHDALSRGELVEPFGLAGRIPGDAAYWVIAPAGAQMRPEVSAFISWVHSEAAITRMALGDSLASSRPD